MEKDQNSSTVTEDNFDEFKTLITMETSENTYEDTFQTGKAYFLIDSNLEIKTNNHEDDAEYGEYFERNVRRNNGCQQSTDRNNERIRPRVRQSRTKILYGSRKPSGNRYASGVYAF